jgi:hypothetical protein
MTWDTLTPWRFALPPSLDKDRHTVAEEVAPVRALTPEQRLVLVASVCRSALALLNLNPKRDRLLALRDPVPASTRAAWKRLRGGR